jgi:hypothetical protein
MNFQTILFAGSHCGSGGPISLADKQLFTVLVKRIRKGLYVITCFSKTGYALPLHFACHAGQKKIEKTQIALAHSLTLL